MLRTDLVGWWCLAYRRARTGLLQGWRGLASKGGQFRVATVKLSTDRIRQDRHQISVILLAKVTGLNGAGRMTTEYAHGGRADEGLDVRRGIRRLRATRVTGRQLQAISSTGGDTAWVELGEYSLLSLIHI